MPYFQNKVTFENLTQKIRIIIIPISLFLFLMYLTNCSAEDEKKEKRCQQARRILQLCLLINERDSRFCDSQTAGVYNSCGTFL
ncbi:hypothetical protein EHQ68_12695 [Leptospira congkakensis]|uniref:Uncharacterized protein n=1 Tax=Leptospira congkakensis TaxID=2484932 RepID=A0A8B5N1H5_9LEPT|nr:hypothetical protein [Leptospira congkakensis]TGL87011.1 hypothetical protein EHQ69_17875 [Leptospira congkakensis]TGL87395.1 hypothetical protein EHQ68_12695 [Leptospira congkakensis]